MRILIADDHQGMRAAICSELESHRDFEICYEARNGEEAVLETLRLVPDLVILDIAMPLKNGFATARESRRTHPEIPILMISARKDEDAIEESKLVRAQGFVTKTDVPFVLLEAVDKLIQGQTFFES